MLVTIDLVRLEIVDLAMNRSVRGDDLFSTYKELTNLVFLLFIVGLRAVLRCGDFLVETPIVLVDRFQVHVTFSEDFCGLRGSERN